MRVVVIICADAEWASVTRLFPDAAIQAAGPVERFRAEVDVRELTFVRGGWGRIAAAASTQFVIDEMRPDFIINLGTCGGFRGRIEQGSVVLVEKALVYDIVEQMGDADAALEHYSTDLDLRWLPSVLPLPVWRGLLISGDRDIVPGEIPGLIAKYDAVAADWESAAIAWVARKNNQRVLILRGVTDLVDTERGEAYGDYQLFSQRTDDMMRRLIDALPLWLDAIEATATPRVA
jgi:adenosylhomocysteine nucleosidase